MRLIHTLKLNKNRTQAEKICDVKAKYFEISV